MTRPDTDAGQSIQRFLALAGEGRPRPAIALGLELLADGRSLEQVIVDVLAPVQREVGVRWETNRWGVADEHAATAVVDGVLGALSLQTTDRDLGRGEVLVACAEGEHHTMPARMGVELLRADGWDVTFLGGSLPADDLRRFTEEHQPDAVVVSCTVPLFLHGARRCFAAVGAVGVPALAAGAAFGADASRALRLGARAWLNSPVELPALLENLGPQPQAPPRPQEALSLELDHEALQTLCLEVMAQRMPVLATYSPAQLSSTRTDVGYILGYLGAAVDLDEDRIFEDFITWLSGVLSSRSLPPTVLVRSLQVIGEVLEGAGMTHAARLCAQHEWSRAVATPQRP